MAWSEADQNPSLAPTANSTPTYAQTLNAYTYGTGGGSAASSTTAAGGGRDYAKQLAATAAPARKQTTSHALEQSAARRATPRTPSADTGGYVVRRGDNLTAIGKRFGVSAADIARANGIRNPNRIGVGQQLMIPGMAEPPQVDIPNPRPRPAREVAMPTPRMRPGPRQAQVDPGRFDDAFAYAPSPEEMGAPFNALDRTGVPDPRPRPQRQTVQQPTARWNIDGALDNMESTRLAEDAAGTRRAMEAVQPAYRAPRQSEADRADAATRVDAQGNYVLPPAGGARPEGPAGGMPAARWQPTVAGRQEVPGALPAARQAPPANLTPASRPISTDPSFGVDYRVARDTRRGAAEQDARMAAFDAGMESDRVARDLYTRRREMEQYVPSYRAPSPQQQPAPVQRQAPQAAQESTTGTWSDLPDPTPPGYGAPRVDPLAGRFNDAFDQPAPGTIMDLRPAYETRRPTINQPPGPPVFVTPSGVRVWAAR